MTERAGPAADLARLRELADRQAIAEVYARYALALDDQDADMLTLVFADDVEFVPGNPAIPRRIGARAQVGRVLERHRERAFTERHWCARPVIRSLSASRAEASAEAFIVERVAAGAPMIESMGRYDDILEKRQGRWVFVRRAFARDP